MSEFRELAREIVTKVARETAAILHTRHDLDDEDIDIEEADFCDEAEALATGEECGCADPDEAIEESLMVWVERKLHMNAEGVAAQDIAETMSPKYPDT